MKNILQLRVVDLLLIGVCLLISSLMLIIRWYVLSESGHIFINQFGFNFISFHIKGCHDIYSSFDNYVEVERQEDDNKYHIDNHHLHVTNHLAVVKMKTT
jgi:hypothetical protein